MSAKLDAARSLARATCAVTLALLAMSAPSRAQQDLFASPAEKAQTSSARLFAGGFDRDFYTVGVQIELSAHTVTYWRQPGDAGAAPIFDFSESENVGAVEVFYPAPKHLEEAGGIVAGYDKTVVFPLRVAPRDAKAPVKLDLRLSYAACYKICLPARAHLTLGMPLKDTSPYKDEIARAFSLVPKKLSAAEAKNVLSVARQTEKNTWRVTFAGSDKPLDVFVEAPDPLYLDATRARGGDGFDVVLQSGTADKIDAVLTVITDAGAFEAPVTLQ